MRAFRTAALAATLLFPLAAFAQDTDESLWLAAYGQGTFGAKGRLHLEFQSRFTHDMSELDRMILRYAVGRQIAPRIVVLAGHAWIPIFQPTLRHEQRAWQQMLVTARASGWTIATRLRTEERWLPDVEGVSYRVRGQLRVTHPLRDGSPWSAAIAEEVAVSVNSREGGPQQGLDRSRLQAGVFRQIRPSLSMESSYTWEAIRRVAAPYRHNHVVALEHDVEIRVVDGYYGQPLLKAPVWTWEVPAYFFAGGAAGIAAVIAAVGTFAGADPSLVRDARWVAAAGAIISPALLISDLGRPSRFLNMLRVFKVQSAMSMGAWTLALFTPSVLASILWGPGGIVSDPSLGLRVAGYAAGIIGALTGLVLATYTGVLLGVSAIPVWAAHAAALPVHFAASSLGAAVSILELFGHRTPAMNALGIAAALALTIAGARIEIARHPVSKPLTSGRSGLLTRLGDALSGPVPLVLRLVWPGDAPARVVAAAAAIGGSLVTRFGWIAAGKASIAVTLIALVAGPALVSAQKPDLSTKALVSAAAKYVAEYQNQFKFLLADEDYRQTVHNDQGEVRHETRMKGELFLTYLPADDEWIAVHDIAEVDGRRIPDRDDLRALLLKTDVRGIAARVADRNARFNIGSIHRNFNEPTLPLLLVGPKRVRNVSFERREVLATGGRTRVELAFTERERPTLVRSTLGQHLYAKGTLTIDAVTGRVERTEFEIKDSGVLSRLTTEYALDDKLGLWVPSVFRERYEGSRGREHEIVLCEARYTNYRRFDVTAKIKR